jgi:hypothetical protein
VANNLDREDYRAWLRDICVTTRFDLSENWVFKLEGHKMAGAACLQGADNPDPRVENPGSTEDRYRKNWYLTGAKLTYNF